MANSNKNEFALLYHRDMRNLRRLGDLGSRHLFLVFFFRKFDLYFTIRFKMAAVLFIYLCLVYSLANISHRNPRWPMFMKNNTMIKKSKPN